MQVELRLMAAAQALSVILAVIRAAAVGFFPSIVLFSLSSENPTGIGYTFVTQMFRPE